MRLVLLGPPGAGKGTQAVVLSEKLKIPHISTGDILREAVRASSDIGKKAKSYMDKGELVPDNIVTQIVVERLAKEDALKGFILDGYPRTKSQAESLSSALGLRGIKIDRALYLKTSVSTIIARLSGRRICSKCNAIYHTKNSPPKKAGVCDKCASGLYQRDDDKEGPIEKRLEVYNKTEGEVVNFYKDEGILKEFSGDMDVQELYRSLIIAFKEEALL